MSSFLLTLPRRLEGYIIYVCRNIAVLLDATTTLRHSRVFSEKRIHAQAYSLPGAFIILHTTHTHRIQTLCVPQQYSFFSFIFLCVHLCSLLRLFYIFSTRLSYTHHFRRRRERVKCSRVTTAFSRKANRFSLEKVRDLEILSRSGAYGRSYYDSRHRKTLTQVRT